MIVKGSAQQIKQQQMFEVFDLPLSAWHAGPKPYFVRIEPDQVTGRRFQVADPN